MKVWASKILIENQSFWIVEKGKEALREWRCRENTRVETTGKAISNSVYKSAQVSGSFLQYK